MPRGSEKRFLQLYDEAWLHQRYVQERHSAEEIAAEVGCSKVAVNKALQRFRISKPKAARSGASHEAWARWLERGGIAGGRPFGAEEHLCAREELGLDSVEELLVLSANHDPFYIDDSKREQAKWFAVLWIEYGSSGHIRRIHYQWFSTEGSTLWDGRPYENTTEFEAAMNDAARYARILDLIDPLEFTDRRNPDPIVNVEAREFEPEPGAYFDDDEFTAPLDLPTTFVPYASLSLPKLWTPGLWTPPPEPDVYGYDYEPVDQPRVLEVWIGKTTMNDILKPLCEELKVNLVPAAGMQSITSSAKLLARCRKYGKAGHALYISDYDSAGDNMPYAVARQLEFFRQRDFPDVEASLEPIALTREQVETLDHALRQGPGRFEQPGLRGLAGRRERHRRRG